MRRILKMLAVPLVVVPLVLATTGTAFADGGVPVTCSLTLQVVDPGTDVVKMKDDKIKIKNSGQVAVGLLLDVSGSMNPWMHVVEQTAAVFAEGLSRKRGINFACWTYTGGYT